MAWYWQWTSAELTQMSFTKENLTPLCQHLFDEVTPELPGEIAQRMTCSRSVRNHGSYRTVLLFNVWDKYQSDVLPKQHFCYCLGYDPSQLISGGTNWYLHLWLNTIRIYRDRLAVKEKLERQLAQACPKGFRFEIMDRAVQAKINFDWNKKPSDLVQFLKPKYIQLISAIHPILMPVIDKFSVYGARSEIKAEVKRRGRIPHAPVRIARPELIEEYSRSIPPAWRREVLEKHNSCCVHCGKDLRSLAWHMDHIIPFTKGGKRKKENFQPLCVPCNLKKGNRFIG
jgi:hypothetical protein